MELVWSIYIRVQDNKNCFVFDKSKTKDMHMYDLSDKLMGNY